MPPNLEGIKNAFEKNKVVWIIIQIIAGLVTGYIIYMISLLAMRADRLVIDAKYNMGGKKEVNIIDGYAESSSLHMKNFNTSLPYAPNFLPIKPSVNLKGGAQFTYSLWLHVADPQAALNKVIFLKGDNNMYKISRTNNKTLEAVNMNDRIAYCPMLSFGDKPMEFVLSFNTFNKMDEKMFIKRVPNENPNFRQNMLSLFSDKWVCLTIVFEDNIPINDFENGIVVKFYVNDTLYEIGRYTSGLKQNNGDLFIFPNKSGAIANCRMSDFKYFNYALTPAEVKNLATRGPSTKSANPPTASSIISSNLLSDYNRLDLYNI